MMTLSSLLEACRQVDAQAREHVADRDDTPGGRSALTDAARRMGMDFDELHTAGFDRMTRLAHALRRTGVALSAEGEARVVELCVAAWADGIEVGLGYRRLEPLRRRRLGGWW